MTRDAIMAFVQRDWARLAAAKARTWRAAKRSPAADLRAADELRRYTRGLRPDWPDDDERRDDRSTHVRVSKALGTVAIRSR